MPTNILDDNTNDIVDGKIKTKVEGFELRHAEEKDLDLILSFIKELAEYENMLNEVVATKELLYKNIFVGQHAKVIIGDLNGEPVSFALYFNNFSTFLGSPGIYLEDVFVRPEARNLGIGKVMLAYLAKLVVQNGGGRFEWWCLDWNKSSIGFYMKMGAKRMEDWTVHRVDGSNLTALAKEF